MLLYNCRRISFRSTWQHLLRGLTYPCRVIIGSGNDVSPCWRQAIYRTSARYCLLDACEQITVIFESNQNSHRVRKFISKCLRNRDHFASTSTLYLSTGIRSKAHHTSASGLTICPVLISNLPFQWTKSESLSQEVPCGSQS